MTRDDDDLVVLSWREPLSEAERRRLRDVLASSEETRWFEAAGRALDAETPILAGDDARIEQIVGRVERGKSAARRSGRSRFGRWLAVGLLAAGVSVASVRIPRSWLGALERKSTPASEASPRAPVTDTAPAVSALPPPADTTIPVVGAPMPAAAPLVVEPTPRAIDPAPRRMPPPEKHAVQRESASTEGTPRVEASAVTARFDDVTAATTVAGTTAEELFVAANRARTRGDTADAIALYRRLRSEFPRSMQASGAGVTLGVLYLQQGESAAALQVFRTLRAEAGRNPSAEVLWGLAQALRRTGGTGEERSVLEELVQRHPRSAYVTAARKRISEL
jgi:TolA-binding protein